MELPILGYTQVLTHLHSHQLQLTPNISDSHHMLCHSHPIHTLSHPLQLVTPHDILFTRDTPSLNFVSVRTIKEGSSSHQIHFTPNINTSHHMLFHSHPIHTLSHQQQFTHNVSALHANTCLKRHYCHHVFEETLLSAVFAWQSQRYNLPGCQWQVLVMVSPTRMDAHASKQAGLKPATWASHGLVHSTRPRSGMPASAAPAPDRRLKGCLLQT